MGQAIILFNSDKCPLPSGRVPLNEIGWIASMLGVGGVVGTILAGWLADTIGRKYTMLLTAIPEIVSAIHQSKYFFY